VVSVSSAPANAEGLAGLIVLTGIDRADLTGPVGIDPVDRMGIAPADQIVPIGTGQAIPVDRNLVASARANTVRSAASAAAVARPSQMPARRTTPDSASFHPANAGADKNRWKTDAKRRGNRPGVLHSADVLTM